MNDPIKILLTIKIEDYELPFFRSFHSMLSSITNNRRELSEHLNNRRRLNPKIEKGIFDSDFYLRILSKNSFSQPWDSVSLQPKISNLQNDIEIINVVVDDFVENIVSEQLKDFQYYGTWIFLNRNHGKELSKLESILKSKNTKQIVNFDLETEYSQNTIIGVSNQINLKLIEKLSKFPTELKTFNRRLFEELIAELFHGFGYDVELTKQTRDGGRDIVAIKNNEIALKYLIECKRPDPGNVVGIKPIRELYGVKSDEKASKAILATSTYFSKDALKFVERNKWEMETKDYDGLQEWISQYLKIKTGI